MQVTFKSTCFTIKPVQTGSTSLRIFTKGASGAYPYHTFEIFINSPHQVIAQTGGIIWNMRKMSKGAGCRIKAIQAAISAHPQSSLLILHQDCYRIIAKAGGIICLVAKMRNNACGWI